MVRLAMESKPTHHLTGHMASLTVDFFHHLLICTKTILINKSTITFSLCQRHGIAVGGLEKFKQVADDLMV